ncbi:MAG: hypothetical protein WCE75_08505 [Terracidiphilus sp.]
MSEDELIEHRYRESSAGQQEQAERHLRECPLCAGALKELESDLAQASMVVEAAPPPARDEAWAEEQWQRLRSALEPYPAPRRWAFGLWPRLAWAAAAAVLLASAFVAGRVWEHRSHLTEATNHPAAPAPAPAPAPRPVVVVVLSEHLDRSERLLVQLKHADFSTAETVAPLRDEARQLLAANRICRKDAENVGDPALTNALDRLDVLLARLADHGGSLTPEDLVQLRDEMNAAGLLFEVRVLRSQIPAGKQAPAPARHGGSV